MMNGSKNGEGVKEVLLLFIGCYWLFDMSESGSGLNPGEGQMQRISACPEASDNNMLVIAYSVSISYI
jgi:hypothetical protein